MYCNGSPAARRLTIDASSVSRDDSDREGDNDCLIHRSSFLASCGSSSGFFSRESRRTRSPVTDNFLHEVLNALTSCLKLMSDEEKCRAFEKVQWLRGEVCRGIKRGRGMTQIGLPWSIDLGDRRYLQPPQRCHGMSCESRAAQKSVQLIISCRPRLGCGFTLAGDASAFLHQCAEGNQSSYDTHEQQQHRARLTANNKSCRATTQTTRGNSWAQWPLSGPSSRA